MTAKGFEVCQVLGFSDLGHTRALAAKRAAPTILRTKSSVPISPRGKLRNGFLKDRRSTTPFCQIPV
jgi:hypothetical protein